MGTQLFTFSVTLLLLFQRKAPLYNIHDLLEHEIEIGVLKNTQVYLKSKLLTCRQNAKTIMHTPESLRTPDAESIEYIETVDKNIELEATKQHGHTGTAKLHEKHKQRDQHRGHTENEIHTMGKDFVAGDAHRLANHTTIPSTTTTEHTMTTPSKHGENHSLIYVSSPENTAYTITTCKSHTKYHILPIQVL